MTDITIREDGAEKKVKKLTIGSGDRFTVFTVELEDGTKRHYGGFRMEV